MLEKYTITFPAQMLNLIGAALTELPFKQSAPVIQFIQSEVSRLEAETPPTNASEE